MKQGFFFVVLCAGLFFVACSTAPKTQPQSLALRNEAGRLVLLGAKYLREGQPAAAREYYAEAYRMYTLVDEPEGRIRALDGLGRVPGVDFDPWQKAQEIALASGDEALVALASLLIVERYLFSEDPVLLEKAQTVLSQAIEKLGGRQNDRARALRLYGSSLKQLQRYREAIEAIKTAIDIDKKNRSFIELASDYYVMASIYSKQGDYSAAITYLTSAIEYDRRSENGSGLGSDYLALGTVYEKAGNLEKARVNYQKALDIFTAGRFSDKIEDVKRKINAIK
jgi:tetratricopeptide (TPR) repeat protein